MSALSFAHFVPSFIEAMFPRWMGTDLALYFALDFRYHKSGHDDGLTIMRHVLIHRPHNYTKVLVSPKKGFIEFDSLNFQHGLTVEYFDKYSDHDSCWRSDGFRFIEGDYFKAANTLGIQVPNDMQSYIGFGLASDPRFVLLKSMESVYKDARKDYIKGYNIMLDKQVPLREVHLYIPEE